jgi:predicted methyltransferase
MKKVALAITMASLLAACASAPQNAPVSQEKIAAIVASPDRSADDRQNDQRRKPVQMLAFIGVRPGITALDVSAGRGYTTELIARTVGTTGKVYGQTPRAPSPALAQRQQNAALANMAFVQRPFEDPVPPEAQGKLDLVTLMFNYHDMGHLGVDRAKMNAAIFRGLKPGGMFVIADHSGRPGTGISESGTLHRVEEAFLVREVEAAGFRLAAHGDFLRNPSDPRDRETPQPAMPKDEFVLKFVKP